MRDQSMKVIRKDAPANHFNDRKQTVKKLQKIPYNKKVNLIYQM